MFVSFACTNRHDSRSTLILLIKSLCFLCILLPYTLSNEAEPAGGAEGVLDNQADHVIQSTAAGNAHVCWGQGEGGAEACINPHLSPEVYPVEGGTHEEVNADTPGVPPSPQATPFVEDVQEVQELMTSWEPPPEAVEVASSEATSPSSTAPVLNSVADGKEDEGNGIMHEAELTDPMVLQEASSSELGRTMGNGTVSQSHEVGTEAIAEAHAAPPPPPASESVHDSSLEDWGERQEAPNQSSTETDRQAIPLPLDRGDDHATEPLQRKTSVSELPSEGGSVARDTTSTGTDTTTPLPPPPAPAALSPPPPTTSSREPLSNMSEDPTKTPPKHVPSLNTTVVKPANVSTSPNKTTVTLPISPVVHPSGPPPPAPPGPRLAQEELLVNLASRADGAAVVAANKEARKPEKAIDEDEDSFMKNDCSAQKWLILELSSLGTVKSLALTMKEMYSGRVKEFTVKGRQTHPRKDGADLASHLDSSNWQLLGSFIAENKKGQQTFVLPQPQRVRYLLLQVLSHYGNEAVCALNSLEVFGVSAAKELEALLALPDDPDEFDHQQGASADIDLASDQWNFDLDSLEVKDNLDEDPHGNDSVPVGDGTMHPLNNSALLGIASEVNKSLALDKPTDPELPALRPKSSIQFSMPEGPAWNNSTMAPATSTDLAVSPSVVSSGEVHPPPGSPPDDTPSATVTEGRRTASTGAEGLAVEGVEELPKENKAVGNMEPGDGEGRNSNATAATPARANLSNIVSASPPPAVTVQGAAANGKAASGPTSAAPTGGKNGQASKGPSGDEGAQTQEAPPSPAKNPSVVDSLMDGGLSSKPKQIGNLFDVIKQEMMALKVNQGKVNKKLDSVNKKFAELDENIARLESLANKAEVALQALELVAKNVAVGEVLESFRGDIRRVEDRVEEGQQKQQQLHAWEVSLTLYVTMLLGVVVLMMSRVGTTPHWAFRSFVLMMTLTNGIMTLAINFPHVYEAHAQTAIRLVHALQAALNENLL